MNNIIVLLMAAGSGQRFGNTGLPKQYQSLLGQPVLAHSLRRLLDHPAITKVYVVIDQGHLAHYTTAVKTLADHPKLSPSPLTGGQDRQQSVALALKQLSEDEKHGRVLVHDAARPCLSRALIERLVSADGEVVIPALPVTDTLRRFKSDECQTVARDDLYSVQTPQLFDAKTLGQLHQKYASESVTDDAALFEKAGIKITKIAGDVDNIKITMTQDLERAAAILMNTHPDIRMATGYDVHAFDTPREGRQLMLGGIAIPHDRVLAGHSDADVVLHAITDALLGCLAAQDIGHHFSPKDERWKNADSAQFLQHAADMVTARGGLISHIDATIICEEPKIGPHRQAMRDRIASLLSLTADRVSIKATTSEGLGFTGRREGIAAQASAVIRLPA